MPFRSTLLFVLAFAAGTAGPGHAQEQVARVKSAPQDYRDRSMQLVGEVVEVRALSPRSERGVYRLVDESDPVGLLVRTVKLPESGGPFRVRARLSPELLQDGVLLVDEIDRTLARSNMLPVALAIGALGLLACLVLAGMYIRARRDERRLRLGPPMWLIPAAVEEPKAAEGEGAEPSPLHFNYRLHYIEQERSSSLERRKQQLLLAVAGTAVVAVAGAGWFVALRQEDAAKPAFVLLSPNPVAPGTPLASDTADTVPVPVTRPDDTLRVAVATPVAPPPPPPATRPSRDTVRRSPTPAASQPQTRQAPTRQDTAPTRREPQPQPVRQEPQPVRRDTVPFRQDTARSGTQVVVVTVPRDTAGAATQPGVTSPPPPPPVTRPARTDTAATPAPAPRPDPALLRRAAETELSAGLLRFVGALDARQMATVAAMYPGAGDSRREKFLGFLRQYTPSATLRGSESPSLTETAAQTSFTIGFRWRAEFGVERRKDVRFEATARRSGNGWAFETVRLLEAFP